MGKVFLEHYDSLCPKNCKHCGIQHSTQNNLLKEVKTLDNNGASVYSNVYNIIEGNVQKVGCYFDDVYDNDVIFDTYNCLHVKELYCRNCCVFVGWKNYKANFVDFVLI